MKTGIELIAEERAKIFASRGKLEGGMQHGCARRESG